MTVSSALPGTTRIALARDARTSLGLPTALVAAGVGLLALAGAAIVLQLPTFLALVLGLAGIGVAAGGIWVLLRIRSLRLAVEPDYLHLTGRGVDRRYHLAKGSLARVGSASVVRARRTGSLGGTVGPAQLAGGEGVELIRLGRTPSVILVPTESGRVALAPAREDELVQALMEAAKTRAERAPTALPPAPMAPAAAAATASIAAVAPPVQVAPPPAPVAPARPLTGIERMALEERMAEERRAAMSGARTEQAAASFATAAALSPPARPAIPYPTPAAPIPPLAPPEAPPVPPTPVPAPEVPTETSAIATPARSSAVASLAPVAATPSAEAATTPSPAVQRFPQALPRRRPLRPTAAPLGRPILTADVGLMVAPLATAAAVWFVAAATGAAPGGNGLDPLGAALLLCGPIALLAVFLARSRWPRLAGLTSVSALIALALVARALIG